MLFITENTLKSRARRGHTATHILDYWAYKITVGQYPDFVRSQEPEGSDLQIPGLSGHWSSGAWRREAGPHGPSRSLCDLPSLKAFSVSPRNGAFEIILVQFPKSTNEPREGAGLPRLHSQVTPGPGVSSPGRAPHTPTSSSPASCTVAPPCGHQV